MNNSISELKAYIKAAENICFLTGAGVSTESGIPDFRSRSGIWTTNIGLEDVVSRAYFDQNPDSFWEYFKEIFQIKLFGNYKPNSAHIYMAELEKQGKNVSVITQNIDGLHGKAGSTTIYEIHGTLQTAHCPVCFERYDLHLINEHMIPRCQTNNCQTILKPDVVLFGDIIHHFEEAVQAALESDLFITLGSSLSVTPINQIPQYVAMHSSAKTVMINKEATLMDRYFDLHLYDSIGHVITELKR